MHFSTVNVGGYWVVKPKKRKIKEISFFGIKNIQRKKKSLISLISSLCFFFLKAISNIFLTRRFNAKINIYGGKEN